MKREAREVMMPIPQIGESAPAFAVVNQNDQQIALADLQGKRVVLYFYPKALTPGCTTQACGIRDVAAELRDLNAVALGISPDSTSSLRKFIAKHELNFDLLSDPDHAVAEAYGVWQMKKFMGKEFMGIVRTTFIIDQSGRLAAILDKFKTKDHHEQVVEWLQTNP